MTFFGENRTKRIPDNVLIIIRLKSKINEEFMRRTECSYKLFSFHIP